MDSNSARSDTLSSAPGIALAVAMIEQVTTFCNLTCSQVHTHKVRFTKVRSIRKHLQRYIYIVCFLFVRERNGSALFNYYNFINGMFKIANQDDILLL